MTTVASTADPAAPPIVQQMPAVESAMQGLGPQIATDAESGEFAQILADIQQATGMLDGQSNSASGASTVTTTPTTVASDGGSDSSGAAVVADAEKYLGVPYQWGGTNPATGLDCSGLVQRVYADLGVSLPRTSEEQANVGQPVASLAQAQPGDLVFFPGSDGTTAAPGHVGIYIGNGLMIDAPHTGTTVQIEPVGSPSEIRRILPSGTADAAAATGASTAAPLNVPSNLAPLFLSAGATYGVSPQLLAAVAKQESGFDPNAVSSAGAEGLMQIMPTTAQGLGVNPFDPAQAIDGAAQILSGDISKFGSIPLALAAYNAGAGAVEQYGGIPPYPETQQYVNSIMGMLGGGSS